MNGAGSRSFGVPLFSPCARLQPRHLCFVGVLREQWLIRHLPEAKLAVF